MKQEVEILFRISEDARVAKKTILKFGGIFRKTTKTVDTYFYNDYSSQFRPSITGRLNGCLRIRDNNKFLYAYKEDYFNDDGSWSYSDEYETEIANAKSMKDALLKQGFKILTVIDSIKHYYDYKNYEICIEEVKNLGTFIEIEHTSVSHDDIQLVKKDIRDLMRKLDFKEFDELDSGKPELMIRKRRKKAFISYKYTNEKDLEKLRESIQSLSTLLNNYNIDCYSSINEIELFKKNNFSDIERIKYLNKKIDDSDFLLVLINNGSESKGLMYELGYADSRNKPIFLIYKSEDDVTIEKSIASNSLKADIFDTKIDIAKIERLVTLLIYN